MTSLAELYQRNRAGDLDAIPVQQEDPSTWWERFKAHWAAGLGEAQPGQRGGLFPSRINEQGQVELAAPEIALNAADVVQNLPRVGFSEIMRDPDGNRDLIRKLAEGSFDFASMLPAAGVAATKAAPKTVGQRAMVAASKPDDPNTAAILLAMQGQDKPKGITAYHGSPHDFDKFDLSKIGTGEGAQAYGHGLYFAENEGVARSYRDQLASGVMPNRSKAVGHHQMVASKPPYNGDVAAYVQDMRSMMEQKGPDALAEFESIAPLIEGKAPGRLYEVRINADPADFLDWDKPFREQPEKIQKAVETALAKANKAKITPEDDALLEALGPMSDAEKAYDPLANLKGSNLISTLESQLSRPSAAEAMKELGIPGIRYLDQGSRTAGDGSRNYVVFDDALVEILRKYANAPDPTTAAILALLTQQQGGQPQQ